MKKRISALLTTMISSALYSQQGLTTDLSSQYEIGIPFHTLPLVHSFHRNINNFPIVISSKHVVGTYPDNAIFTGNVHITQGNSYLQADKVYLTQKKQKGINDPLRILNITGNVRYDDNQISLRGSRGRMNLNNKDIDIWDGSYQMTGNQGHGKAKLIKKRNKNRYILLKNGSFTSCLPNSNIWSVTGDKVICDPEKQIAKIWRAYFMLGSIPVFYSPYMQFPLGNKSISGFLIPKIKYNTTNHFEFILPYYWKISPNIDITITPHYTNKHLFYRKKNIMWENELRYITNIGSGSLNFNYLPSDKVYQKNKPLIQNKQNHWFFYWKHAGILDQIKQFNIDYTKTGDYTYFNKSNQKYNFINDDYSTLVLDINYLMQNYNITLSTKKFHQFNQKINKNNYSVEPQLDINWYRDSLGPFDLHLYSQIAHFVNTNSNMPESTRFHFESTVNLPWFNHYGNLNAEAKLFATHYQQKNFDQYNKQYNFNLKSSVNRILPRFKVDGRIILERNIKWKYDYTQILEHRIQYLYVPYCDQRKIQNYDSSFLQYDYNSLFRDRIYSGLDRIAPTNQITSSIKTYIYNQSKIDRISASFGQIYHFAKSPYISEDSIDWENSKNKTGPLIWKGDIYWYVMDHLGLRGELQYDTRLSHITIGSNIIEYRYNEERLMQLNYRYASHKYVQAALSHHGNNNSYNSGISQIGIVVGYPIAHKLAIASEYYYDINNNKIANEMIGLKYNSCCYAIHFGYERKINGWNTNNNQNKYNNTIGFNIELRGLNSNYNLGTQQILRSNLIPYESFFHESNDLIS